MVKHFDHLTIVVQDVDRAKAFFALLGFKEAISVVIAGEPFASYMGVPGIEADHVRTCAPFRRIASAWPPSGLLAFRYVQQRYRPRPSLAAALHFRRPTWYRESDHNIRGRTHNALDQRGQRFEGMALLSFVRMPIVGRATPVKLWPDNARRYRH